MFRQIAYFLAGKKKFFLKIYVKFFAVSGEEYATLIKSHKMFYSMGENCSIIPGTFLGNAKFVRMGNNVRLANCWLFTHDGVINMLGKAYKVKLDAVGKISIGNNVFIGHSATVLRNSTIGNNVVIAAGALVKGDIPDNWVVGGVPAKFICSTDELVERLKIETESLPWHSIIEQRETGFDRKLEPELQRLRLKYFFEDG